MAIVTVNLTGYAAFPGSVFWLGPFKFRVYVF